MLSTLRYQESDGSDIHWEKPCRFHGVAYKDGLAYRVTDKLDPSIVDPQNDDRYLWDQAVRLTHDQMGEDLTGKPILFEHDKEKRVGTIFHSWVDEKGKLNIIGEFTGRTELGRWVGRQVRAGLLTDLSIGYDTAVEPRTRKVLHKGIEEVSVVVGGFFPGCTVKVRASGNRTYKNSSGELEIQPGDSVDLHIQQIMEAQPTTQSAPMEVDTTAPAASNPSTAAQHVHQIAEMKKMMLQQREELDALRQLKADVEKQKQDERERYAKENEKKYLDIMATVEELAKADGEEGISDEYKEQMKAMAMDPSGAEVFKNTVRVTASAKRLKTENEKLRKELEEARKQQELVTSSLLMNDPVFSTQREDKRSAKLAARKANSAEKPMGGLMEVDQGAPPATLPSWLKQLGVDVDRESETWKSYGTSPAPTPTSQPVSSPVSGGNVSFGNTESMATGTGTPLVEIPKEAVSRPVTAGVTRRKQKPTAYKSRYNSEIRYPVNPYGANSSGQRDLWDFISKTPGNVSLDGALSHLSGKSFTAMH